MTDRRDVDGRGEEELFGSIKTSGRQDESSHFKRFQLYGDRGIRPRSDTCSAHVTDTYDNDTRRTADNAEREEVGFSGVAQVSPGQYYDVPAGKIIKRHRQ